MLLMTRRLERASRLPIKVVRMLFEMGDDYKVYAGRFILVIFRRST